MSCLCDVTLSVYPHRAGLKNMPGHGGNRTYDLWHSCQVSRFTRESPGFRTDLQVSRWVLKISRDSIKMVLYAWLLHLCSEKTYNLRKYRVFFRKKSVRICKMTLLLKKLVAWKYN